MAGTGDRRPKVQHFSSHLPAGLVWVQVANSALISYTDSGGEGPAVMFSHRFLMDHTMSGRRVIALAPEYRVIT